MIWLLRHAAAEDGSPDAARRLTEEGEQQAEAAGRGLAAIGLKLDACLASPKVRAIDTARIACAHLAADPREEPRLSGGPFDPEDLVLGLGDEVLLVGHEPDFSLAIHRATGAQVRMPKAGVAAIDRGELKVLLRPGDLAALAGR